MLELLNEDQFRWRRHADSEYNLLLSDTKNLPVLDGRDRFLVDKLRSEGRQVEALAHLLLPVGLHVLEDERASLVDGAVERFLRNVV